MTAFIWFGIAGVIACFVLYDVIKTAVHAGVRKALRESSDMIETAVLNAIQASKEEE